MKYLILVLMLVFVVNAGEYKPVSHTVADFYNTASDTVAYSGGDITIKYQLAPFGSGYANFWASNYDNANAYDSLCVVDSIQIDSVAHYINVPKLETNYSWSGQLRFHFITSSDTLTGNVIYQAEDVGAYNLFFRFDFDADSSCVQIWSKYQGQ